jgi:hypothetical protein
MVNEFSKWQLWAAAAIIIILAGLLGFWIGARYAGESVVSGTPAPAPTNEETPTPPPSATSGANAVSAEANAPGMSVRVPVVRLSQAGWVVVHDVARANWVLGARWLPAGEAKNVTVLLLRTTEAGKEYSVMLHADANSNRTFELREDLPLQPMVMATFQVQ